MHRTVIRRGLAVTAFLVMLTLLLRLGFWQLERAAFKDDLLQRRAAVESMLPQELARMMDDSEASHWFFVAARATGTFLSRQQYLLDNRTRQGQAGYEVLTPFRSAAGTVLVNRGWVPVGDDRRVLPAVAVDESDTVISGVVVPPPRAGLLLGADGYDQAEWPRVVQTVDLERIGQQIGVPLWPGMIRLDQDHEACLTCVWPDVGGISPERHRGYAVQWFSLAVALVVLMAVVARMELRSERT